MRIETLEISDGVLAKIESKHGIELYEAKEACYSKQRYVRKDREGLYKVFSRTDAGRFVMVILADRGGAVFNIVTAREMTQNERRSYARQKKG